MHRLAAAHDYEVEIEIMALHEKLDEIRAKDLAELFEASGEGQMSVAQRMITMPIF